MNEEYYMETFIEASKLISEITGYEVNAGDIITRNTPYHSNNVLVLIGLTGNVQGTAMISFSHKSASGIVSSMMGGMEVTDLDEIAKSALAELCNMILGRVAIWLSKDGITIDITPPSVLTGQNIQLSDYSSKANYVNILIGSEYEIDLGVSLREVIYNQ